MNRAHSPAGTEISVRTAAPCSRILFLTKYARAGASSRYRTYQYLPGLHGAGFDCEVAPLFDDRYLTKKYELGRAALSDVVFAFLRRVGQMLRVRRFDLVVIEYELLPYSPALPERWLEWLGVPYAVDYDDALFHQYDQHKRLLVRTLLGGKIARVMQGARLVIAGNDYLAAYARENGAAWVEVLPTVVDPRKYEPRLPSSSAASGTSPFTIGWIGSPATAKYLASIAPALRHMCAKHDATVRLVGSGPIALEGVPLEVLRWSEAGEAADIRSFDVGIMPLPDAPWERGKCGFKLIQYMACAVPVVASPIGANRQIVHHGRNGYLASSQDDWVEALGRMARDPVDRTRMGQEGRRMVEAQYSLQATGPVLARLLAQASSAPQVS